MISIPHAENTLMLVGAGLLRAGAVDALRRFADVFGLAVANTYGVKGLFEWRSEHHMGAVGLQAHDFPLLGFAQADLLLACGVDDVPRAQWALAPSVLEIAPEELASLAAGWVRPRAAIRSNDLLQRMSAVVQPLFAADKFPLSPGRAVADYRAVLQASDLLAADAGPAGFWVARAFPTTVLGSIAVPVRSAPGFAVQRALAAAQEGRRALAVTCGPLDEETLSVLVEAKRRGQSLVLDVWIDKPIAGARTVRSVEEHALLLREALEQPGVSLLCTPVDLSDTAKLVDVAGPVSLWPELAIPFAGR